MTSDNPLQNSDFNSTLIGYLFGGLFLLLLDLLEHIVQLLLEVAVLHTELRRQSLQESLALCSQLLALRNLLCIEPPDETFRELCTAGKSSSG